MTARTLAPAEFIAALERAGTRHITAGGVVWHVWGDGNPLVLLHGGTGSWLHWVRNVEGLSHDFMLLAADLPGSGDSDAIEQPITADRMAERLRTGIATIIGPDRHFSIAGFSLGGLIGSHLARLAGECVHRLVLIGSAGTQLPRRQMEPLKSWRRLSSDEEKREVHRTNLGILMLHDPQKVDDLALHIQTKNAMRSRVRGKHFAQMSTLAQCLPDVRARLAGIWGEYDITCTPELAKEKLRQFQPQAPVEIVPDAGHWVQYEAPERFNPLLRALLISRDGR
jgi:2-hydroxy-6-oxonona-2,4-dienedioate hydrolase